jgi:antitoxin MazE
MLTSVRQIGNSRGILIPATFLASCHIEDQVDMQLQDGRIVITPVKRQPRSGWFTPTTPTSEAVLTQERIEAQDWNDVSITDDSEWVW